METAEVNENTISCRTAQEVEVEADLLRLTRHQVAFEVRNPNCVLQVSEVLTDFKIFSNKRVIYSGRAVTSGLINTGKGMVCEATLDDAGLDPENAGPAAPATPQIKAAFEQFLSNWGKYYRIQPEFKALLADMTSYLSDLRLWFEQVELGIRSAPAGERPKLERRTLTELNETVIASFNVMFEKFELAAAQVPPGDKPAHVAWVRRLLHPLLLASPFAERTYQKPLGYAGDYEMVNMILRDPFEGGSLYARAVNAWFLAQPAAEAHRNRIQYLCDRISEVTARAMAAGRKARILSLGCGPAGEVQKFLREKHFSNHAEFTLVDFNAETLAYTRSVMEQLKRDHQRAATIHYVKKSVMQILKEAGGKHAPSERYDYVYCAGLFDYLSDALCKRLSEILYDWVAPGGWFMTTNVDSSNPRQSTMEYVMEWVLIYRSGAELAALKPVAAPEEDSTVRSDLTGVNIYFEARKPGP